MNHSGKSEREGYERQDLTGKVVYRSLIGLGLFVLIVHLVLTGLYPFANHYFQNQNPAPNPMMPASTTDARYPKHDEVMKFPEPRLEENERVEIRDYRMNEEQQLNSYGWVGQPGGGVHIPIDRAKQLIVQRGLPTNPQMGNIPFSVVEMAREAALKSDQSEGAPKQATPKLASPKSSANAARMKQ